MSSFVRVPRVFSKRTGQKRTKEDKKGQKRTRFWDRTKEDKRGHVFRTEQKRTNKYTLLSTVRTKVGKI